jgi:hypothetical protein
MLHLILGGAAVHLDVALDFGWRSGSPRCCTRLWVAQRFTTAAITGLFSVPALQFAEKLTFRIRASL